MLPPSTQQMTVPAEEEKRRDAGLLLRMAAGEASALRELYGLYAGPLYSYLRRALPTPEDAEDALQEVFILLWKKAGNFDPARSSGFTWAWMITRGHCYDLLRSQGRRAVLRGGPSLDDAESTAVIFHAGADLSGRDEIRRVILALDQLSGPERRAIELAIFLEYTGEEVAGELHQPLGTVKSHIRRGLQRLRHILHRHD